MVSVLVTVVVTALGEIVDVSESVTVRGAQVLIVAARCQICDL
jgi:hypothetical protein